MVRNKFCLNKNIYNNLNSEDVKCLYKYLRLEDEYNNAKNLLLKNGKLHYCIIVFLTIRLIHIFMKYYMKIWKRCCRLFSEKQIFY